MVKLLEERRSIGQKLEAKVLVDQLMDLIACLLEDYNAEISRIGGLGLFVEAGQVEGIETSVSTVV